MGQYNLFTGWWISTGKSGWHRAFPYSLQSSVTFFQRSLKLALKFFFFHLVFLLLSACIYFLILKGLNWVKHEVSFLPALPTWSYAPNLIFSTSLRNGSATWVNHIVSVWVRQEATFFLCKMEAIMLTLSLAMLRLGDIMSINSIGTQHSAWHKTGPDLLSFTP